MKILQLDVNHSLITEQLTAKGFTVEEDTTSTYDEILRKIPDYDGVIIRSRIPLDRNFFQHAKNLKFIGRVGAGLENIDAVAAAENGVELINSPEGNRDALAEHVLAMLLVLMNRLFIASEEVKKGIWMREENRGEELKGKIFGIIGYGNMGKAVAKRLSGFGVEVIFHDVIPGLSDEFATQVSLDELKEKADILSLHVPITELTYYLIDNVFITGMQKNFWVINTARGKNVKTKDLVEGLKSGKIRGAALDVLEYEKSSFENVETVNDDFRYLLDSDKVIVTPHIAGWSHQSKKKLAQYTVDKILAKYKA